ncbi:ATP-dependent helicase SGS1 [Exaiptasia diaphana]|nr:ATP-dependent helicase SGS1 [Exaiptasia diaphana]
MEDNSSFEILFENALNALKSFSLDEFREIQQKALKEIVLGKDVLVILPTGSGKSLIFQTAPLVFDEMSGSSGAITIVISPLVSLMKDQHYSSECESVQDQKCIPNYMNDLDAALINGLSDDVDLECNLVIEKIKTAIEAMPPLTGTEINQIEEQTRGQSVNNKWFYHRKGNFLLVNIKRYQS